MTRRAALILAALAGLPAAAAAQTVTCTVDWIEVSANTSLAVSNPNGVLEPGEGARVRLTALITPGIGATATYTPPPAPGSGTIAGLGSVFFDLLQAGAMGGTWTNIVRPPGFVFGSPLGYVEPDGTLRAAQAGQFVLPGSFPNSSNPSVNIWQGTWNPASFTSRVASFQAAAAIASGGNAASILILYGLDPNGLPLHVGRFVPSDFGNTGPIPIIPAPSGLWALAAAALWAARRGTRDARP